MLSTVTALKVISMLQWESLFAAARSTGKPRSAPSRGCNAKPQVRLAAHIHHYHPELSALERKSLTRRAQVMPKKVVPATPTQAKDLRSYFKAGLSRRPDPSEATTSASVIGPRAGTRHLPQFDVNKEPSLVRFQAYLQSIEGKMRKLAVARAIAINVSKSLAFFSSDVEALVPWESLLDEVAVHRSVDPPPGFRGHRSGRPDLQARPPGHCPVIRQGCDTRQGRPGQVSPGTKGRGCPQTLEGRPEAVEEAKEHRAAGGLV